MLAAPFVVLAYRYRALPETLVVLRGPLARGILIAPKSIFTVFRVPAINLTHGLMAAVMLACKDSFADLRRRRAYSGVFLSLLFAVAAKSNLEALELSGLFGSVAHLLALATFASVLVGIAVALVFARRVPFPWPELRIGRGGWIALAGLFAVYLVILAATLAVAHRPN